MPRHFIYFHKKHLVNSVADLLHHHALCVGHPHPEAPPGDPESIVHLDWSAERQGDDDTSPSGYSCSGQGFHAVIISAKSPPIK